MTEKEIQPIAIDGKIIDFKTKEVIEDLNKGINIFKVIETITHDDRRIYELTKNDIGYYNFKGEKLLAHMICNELNGLIEKNKVLYKEIERLRIQNKDLLYSNAKNMESLEKENEQLRFISNENSILWNEIHILIEQGAEPSSAFKKYLDNISTDYDKFWRRKLKQAKRDKVIE